jgi:putative pyruvate formate lyase activating enzyme
MDPQGRFDAAEGRGDMPRIDAAEIRKRADEATRRLEACDLCPRVCRSNRLANKEGYCRTGRHPLVSSFGPHFGEERSLVGREGSGALFFAGCNLGCVFCQNEDVSHRMTGRAVRDDELAQMFTALARYGCHNLNLVTPSHVVPHILYALALAMDRGFDLPVVYNTGGYDSPDALALLDGVVDIYMPDYKFADADVAERLAQARDYPEVVQTALKEMHRQVGELQFDDRGVATRGLLVRHLVLPFGLAGTEKVMRFLADEISPRTYVNIMGQYRPCFHAYQVEQLSRRPTLRELDDATAIAHDAGLTRLDRE